MFKILQRCISQSTIKGKVHLQNVRTFLSQAYYCQEVWDRRLNSPIFQKVNLDEFFYELDQRYQNTRELSSVDVDIFVNAVRNEHHFDELLDIVHKLRLSADTCNTLNSTNHAVVRILMQIGRMETLANVLDDRLNYGVFLDFYSANLLMDTCWKKKDYVSGARVSSQLMLQEDFDHPISQSLSLLHCYNYLLKPEGWPEYPKPEEPEEDVKVRVKFLRNPYDDEHFDLRDPSKIVGKTLAMFTKGKDDPLHKSLNVLGNILLGKQDNFKTSIQNCATKNITLYKEVVDLIPESEKQLISNIHLESANVQEVLCKNVEKAVNACSERDIADQCKVFLKWEEERSKALEKQKERLSKINRLEEIKDLQKALKEKETRLWFFDNEEDIELTIEEGQAVDIKDKQNVKKVADDNYIPPEVFNKQYN